MQSREASPAISLNGIVREVTRASGRLGKVRKGSERHGKARKGTDVGKGPLERVSMTECPQMPENGRIERL
jgi:hypothetical protein